MMFQQGSINIDNYNKMYYSILTGQVEEIKDLLQNFNIDINGAIWGRTFIQMLFESINDYPELLQIIEIFLNDPDINVNVKSAEGIPLIINAALQYNEMAFNLLLAHPKIDVNQDFLILMTPLSIAIKSEKVEMLKALLAQPKIDVNIKVNDESLLLWAAKKGKIEEVKALLAHKDINIFDLPEYEFAPEIEELLVAKRIELLTNDVKTCDDDLVTIALSDNETKNESEEVDFSGNVYVAEDANGNM